MKIDKQKAVAFSGHRILDDDFSESLLEETILRYIESGYKYFLVGMALGFDTRCFLLLERLRKTYKSLKIIACIPCSEQPDNFSKKDRDLYYEMIKSADEQVLVSPSYYRGCMQKRNKFMVDNASVLIAYLNKKSGGTYSTVKYAEKCQVQITYV